MRQTSIIGITLSLFLASCVVENKNEDCIKQFKIIKTTTPSPDLLTADLSIENDTLKEVIEKRNYSKVYFQSENLKMINWGYGTMLVYYDTIKKLYIAEQEYIVIIEKSQREKDSIAEVFRKNVVFVVEEKNGHIYKIKNHCY